MNVIYRVLLISLMLLMLVSVNVADVKIDSSESTDTTSPFTSNSSDGFFSPLDFIDSAYELNPPIGSGIELIESNTITFAVTNYGAYCVSWYDEENYGFFYNVAEMNEPDHNLGNFAYTDSPGTYYMPDDFENGFEIECGINSTISIPNTAEDFTLSFWGHWDIEENFDGVQVLVSNNGGSSWDPLQYPDMNLCLQSTDKLNAGEYYYWGLQGGYNNYSEQIVSGNLNPYKGDNILFKFWFGADGQQPTEPRFDGFYLDDLRVWGDGSTGNIFSMAFEGPLSLKWFSESPWDKTVSTPVVGNLAYFGQFLVGISSTYVAKDNYLDQSVDDWEPISDWFDDKAQYCYFHNTRQTNQAELEVYEVCYSELNSAHVTSEDFIIVDIFFKNVGSSTLTDIYPGIQFDLQMIVPPDYDHNNDEMEAIYNTTDMIYLHDYGDSDNVNVGVVFLGAGLVTEGTYDDSLYSGKPELINQSNYFFDNGILWNRLSTAGLNTVSSSPGNYAFIMGTHLDSLDVNAWYRFSFAILGSRHGFNELLTTANLAKLTYVDLPDEPINITIQSTSLGSIKSMFSE